MTREAWRQETARRRAERTLMRERQTFSPGCLGLALAEGQWWAWDEVVDGEPRRAALKIHGRTDPWGSQVWTVNTFGGTLLLGSYLVRRLRALDAKVVPDDEGLAIHQASVARWRKAPETA
jgi:hypothetical protein